MAKSKTVKGAPPFSRFEWMMSLRYLRARRKDTFISVIAGLTLTGVAIGVATLIVVMSVMNGFREELLSKILGLNGHFTVYPVNFDFEDYPSVVEQIEQIEGVISVIAFAEGQALASGLQDSSGVVIRGMDTQSLEKLPLLLSSATLGSFDNWDTSDGAAIGIRMARKLQLTVGDSITIISPKGTVTPFGTAPRIKSFPIAAIFDLGMVEFDSFFVFLPLEQAQNYFSLYRDILRPGIEQPDVFASDEDIAAAYERIRRVTTLEIFLDDPDKTGAIRDKIQAGVNRPLILTDWQTRNETFFSALQVERVVMFVILSMIIIVAAFNIISSLVMLVKDKSADIAVMRTMGATRNSIMRIFCITGSFIGLAGTLLGLAVGLLISINAEAIRAGISSLTGLKIFPPEIFLLSSLPTKIDPAEISLVVCMAFGLTFLATLYPAWRAAQYDPVEALRYE